MSQVLRVDSLLQQCRAVFIGALGRNAFLVHYFGKHSQALLLRIPNKQERVKSPKKTKYKETCQQGLT